MLSQHLDVTAVPRRYFFELLSHFASNVQERDRLRDFCAPELQDERYSYSNRVRRTCLEALQVMCVDAAVACSDHVQDFPSTRHAIPLAYMFDLFKPIKARTFSIASSQLVCRHVHSG